MGYVNYQLDHVPVCKFIHSQFNYNAFFSGLIQNLSMYSNLLLMNFVFVIVQIVLSYQTYVLFKINV